MLDADSLDQVDASNRVLRLLDGFSLEMTGKDVDALVAAKTSIPPGTRINVTFLANEDLPMRRAAARAVADLGFVPVPHIAARRVRDQGMLEEYLGALESDGTSGEVFVVGGDPARPEGPYEDALGVIATGRLPAFGVTSAGFAGYPEGHPDIDAERLWAALDGKAAATGEQGIAGPIITQFSFDAGPVLAWIEAVRARGIRAPIRIGVPGPAGVKRLLAFAARFGVASSAGVARKYGLSLTNLLGTAGPNALIGDLAAGYDPVRHGEVSLHFYTFGGIGPTAAWIEEFRQRLR